MGLPKPCLGRMMNIGPLPEMFSVKEEGWRDEAFDYKLWK
jgi:hypothetical protein